MVSNVAMLTSDYWPNIGGIAAHVGHLSRALVRQGIRVTIYNFTEREDLPIEESDLGVRILRFIQRRPRSRWRRGAEIHRLASCVASIFADSAPDVAHFHTLSEGLILRLGPRRIPRIFTNHTSEFLEMWESPLRRARLRLTIPRCEAVIAPSKELAEKSSILKVRQSRIHYIPNGVDTNAFPGVDGHEVRERFGIGPDEPVVLCARRFVPKNGLIYFARAISRIVRRVPSARMLFVGGGDPDYTRLVAECVGADGARDRTIFAGPVPSEHMPRYYSAADISVIPSLREATSLTCLESMASCLPVVATDIGGLPELVTDGREGLIVPSEDPVSLGSAIVRLLKDLPRRKAMGRAGREKVVAEYSWDRVAEMTSHVYRNAPVKA